jgi:hypothetical protein
MSARHPQPESGISKLVTSGKSSQKKNGTIHTQFMAILADVHRFQWISMDFNGFQWILMDFIGDLVGFNGFS